MDVRVGGEYELHMYGAAGEHNRVTGEYLVVEPPGLLEFTWSVKVLRAEADRAGDVDNTRVQVQLEADGEATRLLLTHDRFPRASAAEGHEGGWLSCLDQLEQALGK